jgi:thiamine pyrophosphate-dependent acetolactate synthase large subunit-like protein
LDAVKPRPERAKAPARAAQARCETLSVQAIAQALNAASARLDICLTRLPFGWNGEYRPLRHPLDYIGQEAGGGIGAGPGIAVGAALALNGSGRLPVAVVGDGDFLMGVTALWTAVHYQIPGLVLVANNRSFFNDEMHQERVAKERSRPVENKWIGQRITEPEIDITMLARAQGAEAIGPVTRLEDLQPAIERGLWAVREGAVCVVDVRILPGYDAKISGTRAAQRH